MYLNDNIIDLKPYVAGMTEEALKRQYNLTHIVKLASNENPLGPSPKVAKAIATAVPHITRYPDDAAPELREKLAARCQIPASQIIFGAGSSELIQMITRCFVNTGEMIITEHGFILYRIVAKACGAHVVTIADNDFEQDLEGILKACHENTRAIFLANPNNPTGTWIAKDVLENFIMRVPKHITVIIDEAYVDYMTMPEYASAMPLIKKHDNLIVIQTFSKAYGLAGMRFGFAATSPKLADVLARIRKPFNVPSLTLVAANAALDDNDYIQRTIDCNREGMDYLVKECSALGLTPLAQSANFITCEFGDNALTIAQSLLEQGIIIRPLQPYKMLQHLRISIGTMEENKTFVEALKKIR
jgi:histidinol-phosphate aminotransferase